MTRSRASASTQVLNGWHILASLVGFFTLVFVANAIMIYLAVTTFGGLDTTDAYRKGLAYNDRVAAAAAQAKRGWRDALTYLPAPQRLRATLTDASGEGVAGLTITAQVLRPATSRFDQELVLAPTGPGTYEGGAADLDAGWWTVDLTARRTAAGEGSPILYEARRRVWIKP
jgi:nitrogen fixation protein FixH